MAILCEEKVFTVLFSQTGRLQFPVSDGSQSFPDKQKLTRTQLDILLCQEITRFFSDFQPHLNNQLPQMLKVQTFKSVGYKPV